MQHLRQIAILQEIFRMKEVSEFSKKYYPKVNLQLLAKTVLLQELEFPLLFLF
jgi:hypothetical protein